MVREAFSLLRQSIIHVEKDDVDIDEDNENDQGGRGGNGEGMEVDEGAVDAAHESSFNNSSSMAGSGGVPSSHAPREPSASAADTPAPQPKRKTRITYDQYMSIMNLGMFFFSFSSRDKSIRILTLPSPKNGYQSLCISLKRSVEVSPGWNERT